jgi:uncharacterized repeat protein (TIGR03803 family)
MGFVVLGPLSVATCAVALVACGGGSSSSGTGTGTSSNKTATYTILDSFEGPTSGDGVGPNGLILGGDGNFYGTTTEGGTSTSCTTGCGTIFKLVPSSGSKTVLYSFGSSGDGTYPYGNLIQGSDGNFYGTTATGGTGTTCSGGCGTIFRFSPGTGTATVVYSFGTSGDGAYPYGNLIQASDGNLYGTTTAGGTSTSCTGGCGAIFKFSLSSGTETVLYSFGTSGDGAYPYASLIQGSDGNLYGTTAGGGTSTTCSGGCGTVFKYSPSSGTETVLYSFGASGDGTYPYAGVIQASDGNFYGTTAEGGTAKSCTGGCGTVFMFSPGSGTETILHDFGSPGGDGENPYTGLIQGTDGNLYGTTYAGGANNLGTAFMVSPTSGTETVLYNFGSVAGDGETPNANLIQGSNGAFYGTTLFGGAASYGTVFDFTVQ